MSYKIILGITGSIAAYKTPDLVRRLREAGFEVRVVLSAAAKEFVTPLALQAVSGKPVHEHLLDPESESAMSHIELARWADFILIAPCSAHFLAKLAYGLADDLLSTVCLATQSKIVLAPAMNQAMWSNPITQSNIQKLQNLGFIILPTAEGSQACGENGFGRMLEPLAITQHLQELVENSSLANQRILITAGPTQEAIDPVRYLSNHSSGKMGHALAQAALQCGATVTLISGPTHLPAPADVTFIKVNTAQQMLQAVQAEIAQHEVFISAAAVADYRPTSVATQKIKKNDQELILKLEPTVDILATVAKTKPKALLVGFAAETEDLLKHGEAKRLSKAVDLMILNDVSKADIGFNSDENAVTILSEQDPIYLPKASKRKIAQQIMEVIAAYLKR